MHASSVLLEWSTGALFFLWITTRRREVGLGYGWLLRSVFGVMTLGALIFSAREDTSVIAQLWIVGVIVASLTALVQSVQRRKAGVRQQRHERVRRVARVAEMTGNEIAVEEITQREFQPGFDVAAPIAGFMGLVALNHASVLDLSRTLIGALFLGVLTDAMLLGHWYLVQPSLRRDPLQELVKIATVLLPVEVLVFVIPTGMFQVFTGATDDGWNGLFFWIWLVCAVMTLVLLLATRKALTERYYSAVMAATGLLYLAILTGFGTDLIPQAVLA